MKPILVIGDLMLDRFIYGNVSRISPEAPVPVIIRESENRYLGGCGNMSANLRSLQQKVELFGAVGNDDAGKFIENELARIGIDATLSHYDGCTTTKTRFVSSSNQQMLRYDIECPQIGIPDVVSYLERRIQQDSNIGCIVVSDYQKGLLDTDKIARISDIGHNTKIPVLVDSKNTNCESFRNAFLLKPNLGEFCKLSGKSFDKKSSTFVSDIETEARRLIDSYQIGNVLVTLGSFGMILVSSGIQAPLVAQQTNVRNVYDVSGAGDTVMATVAAALNQGIQLGESIRYANLAASIVVQKQGISIPSFDEVFSPRIASQRRAMGLKELKQMVSDIRRRRHDVTIGFTNGCFDCCHYGHIHSLEESRKYCDVLIVGINTDGWIRSHKGPNRPIQDEQTRVAVVSSLEFVDFCITFSDDTPERIISEIRPDVIMKQGYSRENWPESKLVESYGGRAITLTAVDGYSTTNTIKRINDGYSQKSR